MGRETQEEEDICICVRRQWHPTPVLLPGKSHGRRSLVGCSPWGCEESDMTEWLHFHFSLLCTGEGSGNPPQCSCLENPRDGVAQSRTRLMWLNSTHTHTHTHICVYVCGLVAQLCLTLCDPMDYSPPGPSVHGIVQPRILEWVDTSFPRGIFPTQGLNLGLLRYRQILYHLSHQGSLHMCLVMTNSDLIWQKPTQHCKGIIFQLKINIF